MKTFDRVMSVIFFLTIPLAIFFISYFFYNIYTGEAAGPGEEISEFCDTEPAFIGIGAHNEFFPHDAVWVCEKDGLEVLVPRR